MPTTAMARTVEATIASAMLKAAALRLIIDVSDAIAVLLVRVGDDFLSLRFVDPAVGRALIVLGMAWPLSMISTALRLLRGLMGIF